MIETPPMATVDTVGARNLLWILAKVEGIALYTAMDNVVRAVGRIVVCVDAAAELSTMRISRWERNEPNPLLPKTALPRTEITSTVLSLLPSPMPLVPMPANDCEARITMK